MDNYLEQGKLALDEGDIKLALEYFTKALRLSLGDLAEVHYWRGIAYASYEAFDQAMHDFNHALGLNPRYANAYNERGNVLRFMDNLNGALADYNAALMCDPDHVDALYNRALTYEALKQYSHAIADLNKVLVLDSGVAQAYELRGRLYARAGDFNRAIDDLQRYLRMGGGREFDNHSETQSLILSLRLRKWLKRLRPFSVRRTAPSKRHDA